MEAVKSMSHLTYQNTSCPLVDFSAKLRKALEQVEEPRQYACFDVILKDSTVPEGVIILHKGEITISVAMGAKRRISTHNVHTGQILGLASVLSGLPQHGDRTMQDRLCDRVYTSQTIDGHTWQELRPLLGTFQ